MEAINTLFTPVVTYSFYKTIYYRSKILKDSTDPVCKICGQFQETFDHVVAGCPELTKTEYLRRHNGAATYRHWNLYKEFTFNTKEKWYEHESQIVTDKDDIRILWDMPTQTDREIKAKRPDIVVKNKKAKSCLLVEMSIPTERNTSVKVTEKLSKYKDQEIEIERIWGVKAIPISIVIGKPNPGTCKERDEEIHPTDTGQHQNTRATEDHTTWNIAYNLRKAISIK